MTKWYLNTDYVDLEPGRPGYWSWCEELGRVIWVDCSDTKRGEIDADAPKDSD